jgi:hypothetical protein
MYGATIKNYYDQFNGVEQLEISDSQYVITSFVHNYYLQAMYVSISIYT